MALGMNISSIYYSNMKIPQLEPTEYPKWVYMDGYPGVLADDAAQEAELLRRPVKSKTENPIIVPHKEPEKAVEKPTLVLAGPNDEREILLQIAKEKNITVDKRWKTDRLRATIERETAGQ